MPPLSGAVRRYAVDAARAGSAGPGAVRGQAGGPSCGDRVQIELALGGGAIAVARYRVDGCPHATAAAALACELAEGKTFLDAARVGASALAGALDASPAAAGCVAVAADALHHALAAALDGVAPRPSPRRVAVAMSGGVDSAVALLKVLDAGLEPVGVTLRLWLDPEAHHGERACCSPTSVRAAREACHALGVPHLGVDLAEEFRAAVVDDFVAGYADGLTPNPCTRCNGSFRFAALVAIADRLGAPRVATGHYARLVRRAGRPLVARAADPAKDQSYMLARVPPALLERVWFPLGGQTKADTRREAAAAGLAAAGRAESQEVCFLGGGDYRAFLERHGAGRGSGEIVDSAGRVLGRHAGLHRFTPGQRRGLGVASPAPLYVLGADRERRRVVVGARDELARNRVRLAGELFAPVERVSAKLRYRSDAVGARVRREGGRLELELDEPAYGVAPGQTGVLYDGDVVVGAGTIEAAT